MKKAIPTARPKYAGYENIVVDCPICDYELIFNRASDLCTFEPVSGTNVSCEECYRCFWLNGDHVNERHESLIYDCHDLLERKRYSHCILNACQAYEMFFSLYLRVRLLYIPFGSNYSDQNSASSSLAQLKQLSKKLKDKIRTFPFGNMRESFLRLVAEENPPGTLNEAELYVCGKLSRNIGSSDLDLSSTKDGNLETLLRRVRDTNINKLRNDVVHESGYRPMREEAEEALEEARSVLFPLTWCLDLHDDITWYYKSPTRN